MGACDTATVGASNRTSNSAIPGAASACVNSAVSSQRRNDAAIPTRN